MTDRPNAARARAQQAAQALFRSAGAVAPAVIPQEEKSSAMQAYKAAAEATRENMARLKALRLARDTRGKS